MFRKSICSGESTYWRSSLRACLSEARSTIHRLLRGMFNNDRVSEIRRELTCVSSPRSRSPLKHDAGPMAYTNRRVYANIEKTPSDRSWYPACDAPPPFKCLRPSQQHHEGVIESASDARLRRRRHRTPWIPRPMVLKSQKRLISRRRL